MNINAPMSLATARVVAAQQGPMPAVAHQALQVLVAEVDRLNRLRENAAFAVQRWPFVESPGEFTERLREAMENFPLIGAVRHVLIENPPALDYYPAPKSELTEEVRQALARTDADRTVASNTYCDPKRDRTMYMRTVDYDVLRNGLAPIGSTLYASREPGDDGSWGR